MLIQLTPSEMFMAAQVGVMRQVENVKAGRVPAHGCGDANNWQIHCEGAMGECALAKALGIYWTGKGRLRAPDVGEVDVRTTEIPSGRLILHKEDPDDRAFYLLIGVNGRYEVKRWCYGREGKKDEFWEDPTGKGRWAYFVPQSELRRIAIERAA